MEELKIIDEKVKYFSFLEFDFILIIIRTLKIFIL